MTSKLPVWLISFFALTACSGGGGGTSTSPPPPPPPPPPPAAAAPNISISLDKPSVDGGQPFTIDATGSSDPNGDAITFSIEQTAGPTLAEIGGTPDGVFSFQTPRVDTDTAISFTIEASDGSLSSTETVDVTIVEIVRTPIFTQWTDLLDSQIVGDGVNEVFSGIQDMDGGPPLRGIVQVLSRNAQFGDDRLHEVTFASDGTMTIGDGLQLPAISGPAPEDWIYVFDDLNLDTRLDVIQYDPNTGSLAVYQNTDNSGATSLDTIAALTTPATGTSPVACTATSALVGDNRPGFGISEFPGILIGTIGNGLRGVLNDGNPRTDPSQQTIGFSTEATFSTSGSFCAFARARLNSGGIDEIYGYDPERQEVVPIGSPVTSAPAIGQAIPIALPMNGLNLVDMKSGIGQSGQSFLALLFSDGIHEGTHMVAVLQFDGSSVSQLNLMLPNGVPTELLVASIDALGPSASADFDSDILIVVPETPYIYVFVNESDFAGGAVSFSSIGYFETGFDINNVTLHDATQSFGPELIAGAIDGTVSVYRNIEG